MKEKYSTILFDADGTLINFDRDERLALISTMKHYGKDLTDEQIAAYSEINLKLWKKFEKGEIEKDDIKATRFRQFFEYLGMPLPESAYEINNTYLHYLSQGGNLIEGASALLDILKEKGFDMHIVTNGILEVQKKRLKRSGIDKYMGEIFVSELIGFQKPKEEFFSHVFNAISEKEKSKILLVGDSLTSDIKGAQNAKIDSVWLNLKNEQANGEAVATYEITSLKDLLEIIL